MLKIQKDLLKACKAKNFTWFEVVNGYAYRFKKYDNLTFRQIDEVVAELKKSRSSSSERLARHLGVSHVSNTP